jgi:cytochrome c oxidase subunit 2
MRLTRRALGALLVNGAMPLLTAAAPGAQEPPSRREFTISIRDFRFSPDRIEVVQDEVVTLTVRSEDIAYGFAIDEYRVSRRVPAGGATTLEFRADRPGRFRIYSNLSSDAGHARMRGELVVRAR